MPGPLLDPRSRVAAVRLVLWATLFLNLAVALAKLLYGHATATLGLTADGYHSLLDATSNVVGLVGVTIGGASADEDHPYGHRKFEVLSAMVISLFIFRGAWTVLGEAWTRLVPAAGETPPIPRIDAGSFAIELATLAVNVWVARYEARRGRELGSPLLVADAAHTASDVLVTSGVLVSLVLTSLVHPLADAWVAAVLAALLVRTGYRLLTSGAQVVADRVVFDPAQIERLAREVPGILGCARIRTRGLREHAFLDMVVYVAPRATVAEAHALADRVEARLAAELPGLVDIVIHVEPAPE